MDRLLQAVDLQRLGGSPSGPTPRQRRRAHRRAAGCPNVSRTIRRPGIGPTSALERASRRVCLVGRELLDGDAPPLGGSNRRKPDGVRRVGDACPAEASSSRYALDGKQRQFEHLVDRRLELSVHDHRNAVFLRLHC